MSPFKPRRKITRKTAVAINYDKAAMAAPKMVAKGSGVIAERLVAIARENGIPVIEDKVLVETLDQLSVNQQIPPELYQVVAEILVSVYRTDEILKK
jgi:flagellar biosynthesis protein